jgi:SAM-dependent methyltransferase
MNEPLPESLSAVYDSVVDLGTLEHIFDIRQALENVSKLCKTGGQILHVLPSDNFSGHGFWQFSPELFFSLYSKENGYKDTEVYLADVSGESVWYKVLPLESGQRVRLHTSSPTYVIARTVKAGENLPRPKVNQADYELAWKDRLDPKVNQPVNRGPEVASQGFVRKIVNWVRKFWVVELLLISPYRTLLNRRLSLGARNSQLVAVPVESFNRENNGRSNF